MLAYERRGLVYHNLRKWDQAIADYTVAITKDPNNAMALRKRADTYVAMNQFKQAIPDLEAALKLKPEDPDLDAKLAVCAGEGRPAAAASHERRGRDTPPKPPPPAEMSLP